MEIYFLLLTITLISYKIFSVKWYFVVNFTLLGIVAAIRDISIGTDTFMYHGIYDGVIKAPFQYLYYDETLTEIGNRVLMYMASIIFNDSQGYIALSSIIIFSLFGVFYYRCSEKHYWVIPFVFISIETYGFTLNGMRQSLALSIVVFSFLWVKERKLLPALVIVLLGILFHLSVLFYIPLIGLIYLVMKAINKYGHPILWVLFLIIIEITVLFSAYDVFMSMPDIAGEKYALYAADTFSDALDSGISMIIIGIFIIMLLMMYMPSSIKKKQVDYIIGIFISQLVVFSVATSEIMAIFYRCAIMFYPFVPLLFGNYLSRFKNHQLRILISLMIIIFGYINLYYHMQNDIIPYKTFF